MFSRYVSSLFLFLFAFTSCNEKSITYDNQASLETIIKDRLSYDLTNSSKNSAVIIHHKVDCVCTDENVALSDSLINSKKFTDYSFVVVLKSDDHKFLKKVSEKTKGKIKIIIDNDDSFMKEGYISTTDRVIFYRSGKPVRFYDMKITKPSEILEELLAKN